MNLQVLEKLNFKDIGSFSSLFLDYIAEKENLKGFYNEYPRIDNFKSLIENRNFDSKKRKIIAQVLADQYQEIGRKIDSAIFLKENTFTVTTGHQLNIFMSPLYVSYKIITVINLCKQLKATYPDFEFVPIYWLASEDHDFEEISSFTYKKQKFKWENNSKGAVGKLNPNELAAKMDLWGIKNETFKAAYSSFDTLSKAVRYYMDFYFGKHGLICLDADSPDLKSIFRPVIEDDIFNNSAFKLVEKQTKELQKEGYKTQISAREINFFYLDENLRERIEIDGDRFRIAQTDLVFSREEMQNIISNSPEKISPNVVLRPLFQEQILPNLAYIGGPSEVPYWLQLKAMFDFYKTPFPALIPRNFALIIDEKQQADLEGLGLEIGDLFKDQENLKKEFVLKNPEKHISLAEAEKEISKIFEDLKSKVSNLNNTLPITADAFHKKTQNLLESMQKKIIREEKRNYRDDFKRLEKLRSSLFPNGSLQERVDSPLEYLEKDPTFFLDAEENFEPLDFEFYIFKMQLPELS